MGGGGGASIGLCLCTVEPDLAFVANDCPANRMSDAGFVDLKALTELLTSTDPKWPVFIEDFCFFHRHNPWLESSESELIPQHRRTERT